MAELHMNCLFIFWKSWFNVSLGCIVCVYFFRVLVLPLFGHLCDCPEQVLYTLTVDHPVSDHGTPPRLFHSLLAQSWKSLVGWSPWSDTGCQWSLIKVEITTSHMSTQCIAANPKSTAGGASFNLYLVQPITKQRCQKIGDNVSYPTDSLTAHRPGLWSSLEPHPPEDGIVGLQQENICHLFMGF